ncbi:MAG: hypothetical protein WC536_03160 [Patescibacteria group bacterium]
MDYLEEKKENKQLWWISDGRFLQLDDYRKKQLLNPSRTIELPGIDATSHVLNNAAQIAIGMTALIKRGLKSKTEVDHEMVDDIKDNLEIIINFIKAYNIVK